MTIKPKKKVFIKATHLQEFQYPRNVIKNTDENKDFRVLEAKNYQTFTQLAAWINNT